MKRPQLLLFAALLLMASCVAHKHEQVNPNQYIIYGFWYGFWYGLWDGLISPISFIISLFSDSVVVWETHNNGEWYTFGFLLGVGSSVSSSATIKKKR